ncbi:hypothetical protein FRC04_003535 [Tulasnella sp. 424]|nr:hypothetical protein FRC04_003535 [Tulasnella sp. 424]
MRLALVAALLPATVLAAPCGDALVRWRSTIIKSFEWFEGSTPIKPDQLVVPSFGGSDEKKTIWNVLNDRDEFSELVKFIKRDEEYVKRLDDKELGLTFFAPNNEALDKVRHGHESHYGAILNKPGHDDKKEEWIKRYIHDSLQYATLPQAVEYQQFGRNSTYATELHAEDGSFGGRRRRIKVESTTIPPWKVTLNNYAGISESDIRAVNGIIHKLDFPLFLPQDITDTLFLVPTEFSTTLAALEKIALQDRYQFNSNFGKEWNKKHQNDRHGKGFPATTFFAPTNAAWSQLPQDLQMFLFSPFGETTLRKLLAFHTIPDRLVYSEWYGRVHGDDDDESDFVVKYDDNLGFEWDYHFRSLTGQKLPVHVKKFESKVPGSKQYNVEVQAHGLYVRKSDNPAQNGAIHVLDDVLSPRNKEGIDKTQNQNDWNEWKDWLFDSFTSTTEQQPTITNSTSSTPRQRSSSSNLRTSNNSKLSLSISASADSKDRDRALTAHQPYSNAVNGGTTTPGSAVKGGGGGGAVGTVVGATLHSPTPLRNTWVFWFRQQRAPSNKNVNYEEGIKRVTAFSSVESFWSLHTHLNPPSSLQPTTDYLLFHSGVRRPVWEDPLNASGGKWVLRLRKGLADRLWEDLVIAIIGDQFDVEDGICGDERDAEAKARIRDGIRKALNLPPATIMEYKSKSIEKADPTSVDGVEVSDGSHEGRAIPPTRPPIIWNEGFGTFFKSFGERWRSVFDRRLVLSLLAGQLVSLCITCTSVATTSLFQRGFNAPTTQTFFLELIHVHVRCTAPRYFSLFVIYTPYTIYRYGWKGWGKLILRDGWKYFGLACCDVEGNFLVVKAYGYTTLLSCMLLDCWAIPVCMFFQWLYQRPKYHWTQILGVTIAMTGLGLQVLSDHNTEKDYPAVNMVKGDIFMLVGATLYGFTNATEEKFVRSSPLYEVVGQLGMWGTLINGIQASGLEWKNMRDSTWNGETIGLLIAYTAAMIILYTVAPLLYRMASSTYYNLSILSSDFYGLLFGLFLYHYKPYFLYFIAFPITIIGLIVYFWSLPLETQGKLNIQAPTYVEGRVTTHHGDVEASPGHIQELVK